MLPTELLRVLNFKIISTFDGCYKVSGRSAISYEVSKVLIEIKAKATAFLQEVSKVSICTNIWSRKGLSVSFLGVTAHFFSRWDHKQHLM